MNNSQLRRQSNVSSSDSSNAPSIGTIGRGFSRASSADSILDDVSARAHALFSILDEEQTGYLDNRILQKVCDSCLSEAQISELILQLDHDGDGRVSAEDFKQGLRKLARRNSLIRASLKATTTSSTKFNKQTQLSITSDSSDSTRSRIGSDEAGSDFEMRSKKRHRNHSVSRFRPIRTRNKNRQHLHRRLITIASGQQTNSLIKRQSSTSLPDLNSVDECLATLNCQEHLYELYHILLAENPSLSRMYETILLDVVRVVMRSREAQIRMEREIESERAKHSDAIFRLSEELDNQVKQAEESARIRERESAVVKFGVELEAKDIRIRQLTSRLKTLEDREIQRQNNSEQETNNNESNDARVLSLQTKLIQLSQENTNLEAELANVRLQLAQTRAEFTSVKQSLSDKTSELDHQMSTLIEAIKENTALKHQIGKLQYVNRGLYDANDGLCSVLENYPEKSQKHWNLEDITSASNIFPSRDRRLQTDFAKNENQYCKNQALYESLTELDNSALITDTSQQISEIRSPITHKFVRKIFPIRPKSIRRDSAASGLCNDSLHEDSGLSSLRDATELESEIENESAFNLQQKMMDKFNNCITMSARQKLHDSLVHSDVQSIFSSSSVDLNHQAISYQHNPKMVFSKSNNSDLSHCLNDQSSSGRSSNNLSDKISANQSNENLFVEKRSRMTTPTADDKLRVFRIVLTGDSEVGKTSLLIRLCDNIFATNLKTTVGIDMKMLSIEVDGKKSMLQIWDTVGQERFHSVPSSFYRKADGIFLVYDCTNELSFINTRSWISIIQENAGKEVPIVVVGNKTDLREQKEKQGSRCVSFTTGRKLAQDVGSLFFETSAKSGENVNECVVELTRLLCAQEDYNLRRPQIKLTVEPNKPIYSKCCIK